MSEISVDLNSRFACQRAYYDYTRGVNTRGITDDDIKAIKERWGSEIPHWLEQFDEDSNLYEGLDDVSYDNAKQSGLDMAKDSTGYDGKISAGEKTSIYGEAAVSVANAASPAVAGTIVNQVGAGVSNLGAGIGSNALNEAGGKIMEKGTNYSDKAGKASAWISAALAIATTAKYMIQKPNEKEHNASVQLGEEMLPEAQASLAETVAYMEEKEEEIAAKEEEAEKINEENAARIDASTSDYQLYQAAYADLQAKIDAGLELSPDEATLYKAAVAHMQETGGNITDIQDENSELLGANQEDIEGLIGEFDVAEENMAEVQGVTDYADGFDETARTMCYVEGGSRALTAISGGVAGAKLCSTAGLNYVQWGVGIASIAAGVKSGFDAKEQFQYAGDIKDEIHLRRDVQDFNVETGEQLDEHLEIADVAWQDVGELTIDIPDNVEPPTTVSDVPVEENDPSAMYSPAGGNNTSGTTRGASTTNENTPIKPKKDEEKK